MSASAKPAITLPPLPAESFPEWAEWLFRFGCHTAEIAEILDIPEADAERALHEGLEAYR